MWEEDFGVLAGSEAVILAVVASFLLRKKSRDSDKKWQKPRNEKATLNAAKTPREMRYNIFETRDRRRTRKASPLLLML